MGYELSVKECIDNGTNRISGYYSYDKKRLEAFFELVKQNGYEPVETIDNFLDCVSLESEKMFFNATLIILDILRTPVCKKRLIENIYKYPGLVAHLISFFKEFQMENEYSQIATILIENREKNYRSFEEFMCSDWKEGVKRYYKQLKTYPDAKFFECIERDYDLRYGCSAARELLKSCMNHIIESQADLKAEEKFWNENIHNMVRLLAKNEFSGFLTKRYLLLIPNLQFMNREVQEIVVRRLGTRKQSKIFKEGYTRMIAYYIIGRILNGETNVCGLLEDLNSCKRLVDWKELLRILCIAYEETDSYANEKEAFEAICNWIENRLCEGEFDILTIIDCF